MNQYTLLIYSEVDVLCIILLSVVVYKLMRTSGGVQNRLLASTIVGILLFSLSDWCWAVLEYGDVQATIGSKYLLNVCYYVAGAGTSFLWYLYCREILAPGFCSSRKSLFAAATPFLLYVVLAVTTPATHLFFYMDETGTYQRGGGYWIHLLVAYSYIGIVTVQMAYMVLQRDHYANRMRYMTLAGFALPPLLGGISQIFFPLMPLQGPGMTVSVFLVFINLQELQISRDQLTGINNRVNMVSYLEGKMRRRDREDTVSLHLMMIDVDRFKRINDKYGHTEGDAALIRVADALKKGCDSDCFVARYGGDEFAVLCEGRTEAELSALCAQLHESLERENDAADAPYRLSVSIGCATLQDRHKSIPEFIAAADRALYLEKEQHHRLEPVG